MIIFVKYTYYTIRMHVLTRYQCLFCCVMLMLQIFPVPWIMVAGVFLHFYAGRLAYASGSLAKAYVSVVLGVFWLIWTAFLLNGKEQRPVHLPG